MSFYAQRLGPLRYACAPGLGEAVWLYCFVGGGVIPIILADYFFPRELG